jgi:hypothetical protein
MSIPRKGCRLRRSWSPARIELCLTGEGECQELVVLGIAAGCERYHTLDGQGGESQDVEERKPLTQSEVDIKLGTGEYGFQFFQCFCRNDQLAVVGRV